MKRKDINPTPETISAMNEARSGKLGAFETIEELMADLNDVETCMPLTKEWLKRLDELVGDLDVDLDAPLPSDDDFN